MSRATTALILAMTGLAAVTLRAQPTRAADAVFVPTFVDPHVHRDPPDLAGRTIRFLTTDDHPPFNFLAPDGTLTGFNVDLAQAICQTLEAICTIQTRSFESLVAALRGEAGDAVIASLALSEGARDQVAFSLPTFRMAARFAARKAAAPTTVLPETVGHLVIAVQAQTAQEAYLRQFFPQAVAKSFMDPDSMRAALKSGAVDLMFADGLSTALWLNGSAADGCCRFAGGAFTESHYFGDGTGVAVRKSDIALKRALDLALQRLSANGTAGDLYLKYFPIGIY